MAISLVVLLTFVTVHLFQFRLGDTQAQQYLVNIWPGVQRLRFSYAISSGASPDPQTSTHAEEYEWPSPGSLSPSHQPLS